MIQSKSNICEDFPMYRKKWSKIHFTKRKCACIGDTVVLFCTKGMSEFFPKMIDRWSEINFSCIFLVQVYLEKKHATNYFPTGRWKTVVLALHTVLQESATEDKRTEEEPGIFTFKLLVLISCWERPASFKTPPPSPPSSSTQQQSS